VIAAVVAGAGAQGDVDGANLVFVVAPSERSIDFTGAGVVQSAKIVSKLERFSIVSPTGWGC